MKMKLRKIAAFELPTAKCARLKTDPEHICDYLQISHPLGRKVQERWMFLYQCHRTHMGELKNNEKDKYLAYLQANEEDLRKTFPKTWQEHLQAKKYLISKYGDVYPRD